MTAFVLVVVSALGSMAVEGALSGPAAAGLVSGLSLAAGFCCGTEFLKARRRARNRSLMLPAEPAEPWSLRHRG